MANLGESSRLAQISQMGYGARSVGQTSVSDSTSLWTQSPGDAVSASMSSSVHLERPWGRGDHHKGESTMSAMTSPSAIENSMREDNEQMEPSSIHTPLLTNRRAVIFGAGGAVGRAVAKEFAAQGATVFLSGRRLGGLEQVAEEIHKDGWWDRLRRAGGRA
jgi:hypothetical protein